MLQRKGKHRATIVFKDLVSIWKVEFYSIDVEIQNHKVVLNEQKPLERM